MKAVVIGGGIIGLSTAYYMQKEGWDVTLLDSGDLSDNCSYGNLGMVVPSHFVPLAAPGMVAQGIRWMFNSKSPFYVKPSLSPKLASWGLNFIRSANSRHVEASALPLLQMNEYSKKLYGDLKDEPGFDFAYEQKGILMYYKTEKVGEEEVHLAEKARSLGLDVEALDAAQVQALEPDVELDVLGAVHYRCDAHLYPGKLIPQLVRHLESAGVTIRRNRNVESLRTAKGKITGAVANGETIEGDLFVLANGSWLPGLARTAGLNIPLMPGKGYSFTQDQPKKSLNIPAILCEARVAITPMNGHMRFGGTMEIAPVNDGVNMRRVQGIVESVPRYLPGLALEAPERKDVWFGFRPCSPDGLPYVGFNKKFPNLMIAGGHAMMGLSLGPATGKVLADLAGGRKPEVDPAPFDPNRFS